MGSTGGSDAPRPPHRRSRGRRHYRSRRQRWPGLRAEFLEEVLEIQENDGRRVIADAVKVVEDSATGGDRPEINSEMLFGRCVPALADLSKDAELMVVGCRGRTGQHRLLGPVSTGLIHHAHCPVAVIHDEVASSPQSMRLPVVVGIDGSRASELATEIAFDEASWRGVDLVALHVWSDADISTAYGIDSSAVQSAADKALAKSLAGWQERYPEVAVQRVVEFERPVRHLLEQAEKAQLVVVGSHGRGGFGWNVARFGQYRRSAGGSCTGHRCASALSRPPVLQLGQGQEQLLQLGLGHRLLAVGGLAGQAFPHVRWRRS